MTHPVRVAAEKIHPWLIETRRKIHMNPEMAFEEHETSRLVAESMAEWGLDVKPGIAQTGVAGLLDTGRPGPTIGIRADMDALPVQEENEVPYKSKIDGKMHACGHDGHTTMLLGVARVLAENPALLDGVGGRVKFIFQPAEEGRAGGRMMVEEGILEDPRVDLVLAAHVYPEMPLGTIGTHVGPTMGSGDKFFITLRGLSSHAAYPQNSRDPILAAGHVITALQSVVSRNVNPFDSAVVSVTQMEAGVAINIVPEEVQLRGTIRTITPEARELVKARVREVAVGVASGFGVEAEVEIQAGYPSLSNHAGATALVEKAGGEILGPENVLPAPLSLGSEDFAYIAQLRPAAMFRLGIRNEERGIVNGLHNNHFDLDEDVLPMGVSIFVQAVREFLADAESFTS
ncbi:MAG: amidohydrolase [Nitrospinaceae bacterium]|jgi:amidohydrolase|nr:amidohydrolase [Nitrospinaceae bacterium]MBT3434807.1 amidohydrolase [Nitrospinaceae bacterium]MBT4095216.1 amidohydrolase [Nitrospinaceae bacterium]MBT5367875.1 amidohydrolase [Nitrospinaceae bacterium]MBT5946146.1 amidohydrolase [Nitrospinaceae bacterium]